MLDGAFSFMYFYSNRNVVEFLWLVFFPGLEMEGSQAEFKRIFLFDKGPSPDDYVKATVAYKLGRNSLYVESESNANFEKKIDKLIGHTMCNLQLGLDVLCYIPSVIIRCIRFCIIKVMCTFSKMLRSNTNKRLNFEEWLSKERPNDEEKELAYEILIKCCGPSDNIPKGKAEEYAKDAKEKIIEDIFEQDLKLINLPLLLDGSVPSGLLYLLIILDRKLEANSTHELQANVNAPDTHELQTKVNAPYTHV